MKPIRRSLARTLVVVVAVLGLVTPGLNAAEKEPEPAEKKSKPPSRLKRRADGSVEVRLDPPTRARLGLETAPLKAMSLTPEARAYGRVLDPAPLAALIAEIDTAETALTASQKEFERLKALFERDQSASARAVETATAAFRHDQIAAETARLRLIAAWGEPFAKQPELSAAVRSLLTLEAALVRVDLPAGESLHQPPTGVRVAALAGGTVPMEGKLIGPAMNVDPQTQGQGFLVMIRPNPQRLASGTAVTAWLDLPGEPLKGVLVPRAALLRSEGRTWVYVPEGDESFVRREISLEHPAEEGWIVTRGLAADEKVVVIGAQAILSEELKALVPKE